MYLACSIAGTGANVTMDCIWYHLLS